MADRTNVIPIRGDDDLPENQTVAGLAAAIRRTGKLPSNIDLRVFKRGQLAMVVARLTAAMPIQRGGSWKPQAAKKSVVTVRDASRLLGIDEKSSIAARIVFLRGTPKEIAAVDAGERGVNRLAAQIRKGVPPDRRAAAAQLPMNQRGGTPARIARQRLRAEIWGSLRAGLEGLTGLPRAADVVALLRDQGSPNMTAIIDERLLQAQAWLEEFTDEWTRPGPSPQN